MVKRTWVESELTASKVAPQKLEQGAEVIRSSGPPAPLVDVVGPVSVAYDQSLGAGEEDMETVGGGGGEAGGDVLVAARDQGRRAGGQAARVDVGGGVPVGFNQFFFAAEEDPVASGGSAVEDRDRAAVAAAAAASGRDQRGGFGPQVAGVDVEGTVGVGSGEGLGGGEVGESPFGRDAAAGDLEAAVAAAGLAAGFSGGDQRRLAQVEVAHVEVGRAVRVGARQRLFGFEEDFFPVGVDVGEGDGEGAAPPGHQRRGAVVEVAPVDVDAAVGIAGDEALFGREEDQVAEVACALELGRVGIVAAGRAERDRASDVGADVFVERALVDVALGVGVAWDQLLLGFEEDDLAVRRRTLEVGDGGAGERSGHQDRPKRSQRGGDKPSHLGQRA